jgi:hypothetical protein
MSGLLGIHRLDLTLLLTGVFVVIGVVVYKLDWEGVYRRIRGASSTATPASPPNVPG